MSLANQRAVTMESGRTPPGPDLHFVVPAVLLLLGGGGVLAIGYGWRQGSLYLLGGALGLVLYHAAFGFASSWRSFLTKGDGQGIRAQMAMIALASLAFFPLLAGGEAFGQGLGGAVAPLGVSVAAGAFLFGLGMQLGGGCASGTLYTVGGGSTRMLVTLFFFIVGSLLGSAHLPYWLKAPSLGSISLLTELGLPLGLTVQLVLLALVGGLTLAFERYKGFANMPKKNGNGTGRHWLYGPWPLLAGAATLALLNVVTLLLAGHPWTVSFGYTLWGAKIASAVGIDVANWEFWTWRFPAQALAKSWLANTTSVMNLGILVGAFLAAGLAGRFRPSHRLSWRPVIAAAIGGTLMGYGARLAFGCNVGAFFSGIASGSLHGWLWFAAALIGCAVGIKLRPLFGLAGRR